MTPENVNMFQNYANDKALIIDNFDTISEMLPELMSSKELSASDVISINNSIREIFIPEVAVSEEAVVASEQANSQAGQTPVADTAVTNEANTNQSNNIEVNPQNADQVKDAVINNAQDEVIDIVNQNPNSEQAAKAQGIVPESEILTNSKVDINQQVIINENEASNQVLNSFAGEKQITSFNTLLNSLPDFPKDNLQIFSEDGSLRADADINQVFKEITDYFNNHPDIPKETLNDIIREPLYKGILKNIIANSFAMEPKDITKPGEISKLYERVLKQTEALERLMASFSGKAAETIKNQTA